jgi:hypothetical protein
MQTLSPGRPGIRASRVPRVADFRAPPRDEACSCLTYRSQPARCDGRRKSLPSPRDGQCRNLAAGKVSPAQLAREWTVGEAQRCARAAEPIDAGRGVTGHPVGCSCPKIVGVGWSIRMPPSVGWQGASSTKRCGSTVSPRFTAPPGRPHGHRGRHLDTVRS